MIPVKPLFISVIVSSLLISGCDNSSSTNSQPATKNMDTQTNQPPNTSISSVQNLVIYKADEAPQFNKFQATNVSAGNLTSDFNFTPDQDQALILDMTSVKTTLLGCENSDLGFQISLYNVGKDGTLDLSAYKGLGPSPVLVEHGVPYVVRVTLYLKKSCLGIAFRYGVMTDLR